MINEQQRAVVQQALEVLKRCQMNEAYRNFEQESHTITALRQLLEQPEQKPEPACPADWVDLSVEQKMRIHYECEGSISYAIELTLAKLREKNRSAI
jgi:hypothetical protein